LTFSLLDKDTNGGNMDKWTKDLFKDLFADSSKIDPQRRSRINKIMLWAAGGLLVSFVALAAYASHTPVSSDSAWWQAVVSARLTMVRLLMALPVIALGFLSAATLFNIAENSRLGKQYLEPFDGESEEVKSRKISNGGLLLAALVGSLLNALVQSLLK
jgi:hypothetical protein